MKFHSPLGRHGTFWDTFLVDPYIWSIKKLLQGNNPQSIILDTFLNAGRLKVNNIIFILLSDNPIWRNRRHQ